LFGEGEDDVGKTQACDIIQVALKVLRIAHSKVAHAKLHRPTSLTAETRGRGDTGTGTDQFLPASPCRLSSASGHSAHHFGNAQFGTRAWGIEIQMGVIAL